MVKASDFIGGGGGSSFAPVGDSSGSGTGWLVDPALNLNGVEVSTFWAQADSSTHFGYIGSDKVTLGNNHQFYGKGGGNASFVGLHLPAGQGLYCSLNGYVIFKYL